MAPTFNAVDPTDKLEAERKEQQNENGDIVGRNKEMEREADMMRSSAEAPLRMKINGRWLLLSDDFVKGHPGGQVLTQYRSALTIQSAGTDIYIYVNC
jgi:hypothetical protein